MPPYRPELVAVLQAARESPEDPLALRVAADWLEEHGDASDQARAEFIRLWCDRENTSEPWTRWWALRDANVARWLAPIQRADPIPGQAGAMIAVGLDLAGLLRAEEAASEDPEAWAWVATMRLRCWSDDAPRIAACPMLGHCPLLALHGDSAVLPTLLASPHFARVRMLDLGGCGLRASQLSTLLRHLELGRLRRLSFDGSRFGNSGLAALAKASPLPCLRHLSLRMLQPDSGDRIDSEGLARLFASSSFPAMQTLSLTGNALRNHMVQAIAAGPLLGQLQLLDLRDCGLNPGGIMPLASSTRLVPTCKLRLDGNSIGLFGPQLADNLLPDLSLNNCGIDAEAAAALVASPKIRTARSLSLSGNPLGDDGALALAAHDWPQLETLALSKCALGPKGVAALADAPGFATLRVLRLDANPIRTQGGTALARAKGLSRLRVLRIDEQDIKRKATEAALRERFGAALSF